VLAGTTAQTGMGTWSDPNIDPIDQLNTQLLGLAPAVGLRLRADFGILRGDELGQETRERLYWANQATGIVSDVPSEIMLTPGLWGEVRFQ